MIRKIIEVNCESEDSVGALGFSLEQILLLSLFNLLCASLQDLLARSCKLLH